MGLSDSFTPSFSTKVRQYQSGLSDVMYRAQQDANERYLTGMDKMYSNEAALQATQVTEADQGVFDAINSDAQNQIKAWTERGDLENLVPEIHRYSAQLANKLKYLQNQRDAQSQFEQTLNDPKRGLTPEVIAYYKDKAKNDYKGVSFDKYGRPSGRFTAPETFLQIDTTEKVRKAIKDFVRPDADMNTLKQDSLTGQWSIETKEGIETIDPTKILNSLRAARERDSEWQNSNNQEIDAATYNATKGLSEEAAIKFLNDPNTAKGYREKALSYIKEGKSYAEAVRLVERSKIKSRIEDEEERYALGASYTNTSSSKALGPSFGETARFNAALQDEYAQKKEKRDALAAKSKEEEETKPWMSAPDLIPTVNEETDWSEVDKGIKEKEKTHLDLRGKISHLTEQISSTKDDRVKSSLIDERDKLTAQQQAIENSIRDYNERMSYVRSRAAVNLNKDLETSREQERVRFKTLLKDKGIGQNKIDEITEAALDGRLKKVGEKSGTPGAVPGATYYIVKTNGITEPLPKLSEGLFTDTYGKLLKYNGDLAGVQKEAEKNWKAYNKNYSQAVPDILPDPGDKKGKGFIEGLETMLNSQARSSIRFRKRGKDHDVAADKIAEDAKFEVAGIAPVGEGSESRVRVRVMVPKEKGEGYEFSGKYYDAYVPINMHEKLSELYGSSSNAGVRSLLEAFKSGSSYRKIISKPNTSILHQTDDSKFVIQDGVYKIIGKDGKVLKSSDNFEYSTKDAFKAAEWLDFLNSK